MNSVPTPLKGFLFFIFLGWLLFNSPQTTGLYAQVTALGKPGLIMTPNTDWMENRQLGMSFSFIPRTYKISGFMNNYYDDEHIYAVRAGITDWMEIYLNITRLPELSDRIGIGDRHMDFRFRLLKEAKYGVSVVLILSPPGSINQHLNHDSLVLGKKISLGNNGILSLNGGYGFPYILKGSFLSGFDELKFNFVSKKENNMLYLNGFFGGLSWSWKKLFGLQAEYDSRTFNAGFFVKPKPWILLQGHTFEGKDWGATVSVHFPLDGSPKELRSHAE